MTTNFDPERHLKPLVAGGLVILLLFSSWAYSSYRETLHRLDRKLASARTEATSFDIRLNEYRSLELSLRSLQSRGRKNLISSVEDAATKIEAREQLVYVRPQPDKKVDELTEESVEIRLEKLKLNQLVELLYQFETAREALRISQLRLRTRFGSPELLDATILLSRFKAG